MASRSIVFAGTTDVTAEEIQPEDLSTTEDPSLEEEGAGAIYEALGEIGVKHREALVPHFLQDLSIAEIAKVLGCSEGTVKSRIYYTKRQMKQILEGAKHGTAN